MTDQAAYVHPRQKSRTNDGESDNDPLGRQDGLPGREPLLLERRVCVYIFICNAGCECLFMYFHASSSGDAEDKHGPLWQHPTDSSTFCEDRAETTHAYQLSLSQKTTYLQACGS
jgi:hypothetical protein